jgi:hypothetical protein
VSRAGACVQEAINSSRRFIRVLHAVELGTELLISMRLCMAAMSDANLCRAEARRGRVGWAPHI